MSFINFNNRDRRYDDDYVIYDECNDVVSPLHDDYYHYKTLQEDMNNPLSDDYIPEGYRY